MSSKTAISEIEAMIASFEGVIAVRPDYPIRLIGLAEVVTCRDGSLARGPCPKRRCVGRHSSSAHGSATPVNSAVALPGRQLPPAATAFRHNSKARNGCFLLATLTARPLRHCGRDGRQLPPPESTAAMAYRLWKRPKEASAALGPLGA
jgi:hypothetical protein